MIQRDIEQGLLGKITLKETSLFQEFYLVFRKRGGLSRSQAEFVDFVVDHLESTNPAVAWSEALCVVD
jgi:hypothetical protein